MKIKIVKNIFLNYIKLCENNISETVKTIQY